MSNRSQKQKRDYHYKLVGITVILLAVIISAAIWLPPILAGAKNLAPSPSTNSSSITETLANVSLQTKEVTVLATTASSQSTTALQSTTTLQPTTSAQSSAATTATTRTTTSVSTTAKSTSTSKTAASTRTPILDGQLAGKVVVLDPGHQRTSNSGTEPLSPGSATMKAKTSSGTAGVVTRRAEYEVNLEIGLKLKSLLESKGCIVYMTRTSNSVNLSNIDRALFAVSKKPDVFIRLHCNGSENSSVNGVKSYVADSGIFAAKLPEWGRLLAKCQSDATGAKYLGVDASSRYTGLNWATSIPSFLLEMGFMSNAAEDRLLVSPDYQAKICQGIANFVQQMPKR